MIFWCVVVEKLGVDWLMLEVGLLDEVSVLFVSLLRRKMVTKV